MALAGSSKSGNTGAAEQILFPLHIVILLP